MEGSSQFVYNLALGIPGILLAIVLHEYAHGYMALKFGDNTAKESGRLTMNPLMHLDLLGSVIVPVIGAILGGVSFGWAKPVPINTRNFPPKKYKKAVFWVSFAGPLANFTLLVIFALAYAVIRTKVSSEFYLYEPLLKICEQSVLINAVLGTFNLIPLPPLDGSRMLAVYLPPKYEHIMEQISRFGFFIFLFLIFTNILHYILAPAVYFGHFMTRLFTYLLL